MERTNRHWMPDYCRPERFLPPIQRTEALFKNRPYYFPDFLAKALTFLQGDEAEKYGFRFDPDTTLPCKWKCADESLFQVDLALVSYCGHFPFDKGQIGGRFDAGSLGAAVHHGGDNVDFGGSHVGYVPGKNGGEFGRIWRPQHQSYSTDCGYLMGLIAPFCELYADACKNIKVALPAGGRPVVSIPNEFLQPSWSSQSIKLLVDMDTFTAGPVPCDNAIPGGEPVVGHSLFWLNPEVFDALTDEETEQLASEEPTAIGHALQPRFFAIFDTHAQLDSAGVPRQRILGYMNQIVASRLSPSGLKAAVVNANIEYNHLTDTIRAEGYRPYSFACFTGIFIDMFDETTGNYCNLFQPVGLTIKPRGHTRQIDIAPDELRHLLRGVKKAKPAMPMGKALPAKSAKSALDHYTFTPGHFQRNA